VFVGGLIGLQAVVKLALELVELVSLSLVPVSRGVAGIPEAYRKPTWRPQSRAAHPGSEG
jgi:hypothetical protein